MVGIQDFDINDKEPHNFISFISPLLKNNERYELGYAETNSKN